MSYTQICAWSSFKTTLLSSEQQPSSSVWASISLVIPLNINIVKQIITIAKWKRLSLRHEIIQLTNSFDNLIIIYIYQQSYPHLQIIFAINVYLYQCYKTSMQYQMDNILTLLQLMILLNK
ncbi:Hypothetical_protein [Hexamita inflata]|uniref:Hypothetical_protein n=1 Tax=Hexamita inflata TaxID=28002 RepID=A0ABP1HLP5_9EUKA